MEFKLYKDAYEFESTISSILVEKEDVFSLFLGILQAIKAGHYEAPVMGTIHENGEVLALFQMTPPHPLNLIIADETRFDEVTDFLLANIIDKGIDFPSIISLKPWAYGVAEKWQNKTGVSPKLLMDQGLYRLNAVNETLESSTGHWRYAEISDAPLIEKWFNLFEQDTGLPISPIETVQQRVALFLKNREVFLWEDQGQVVSMMKKSRPTENGITVSLVFTPKEARKKGYARTLVAAISKELLKDYQFCMLYTDMLNPTSNKIYQEIGYQKIADSVHLGFTSEKG